MDADRVSVERRRCPRAPLAADDEIAVKVRPGHVARIKELSRTGARIETSCRLLPNSSIELRVETRRGHSFSRAAVIRSILCRLEPGGPVYESALCFVEPLALHDPG